MVSHDRRFDANHANSCVADTSALNAHGKRPAEATVGTPNKEQRTLASQGGRQNNQQAVGGLLEIAQRMKTNNVTFSQGAAPVQQQAQIIAPPVLNMNNQAAAGAAAKSGPSQTRSSGSISDDEIEILFASYSPNTKAKKKNELIQLRLMKEAGMKGNKDNGARIKTEIVKRNNAVGSKSGGNDSGNATMIGNP